MKKKAAERLKPFFSNGLSEMECEKLINQLSPQDLGEIRNLINIKIKEMRANQNEMVKRLNVAECNPEVLQARISDSERSIEAVKETASLFQKVFEKRQIAKGAKTVSTFKM